MKAKTIFKPEAYIFPAPTVLVSCGELGKNENIITIAWTGVVNSDPPMTYVSVRKSRYSHGLISENKEFVINLINTSLLFETDGCGVCSGRDEDKFKKYNFTPMKAEKVKSPLIAECPVHLECVVKHVLELGSHDMFIAEIVAVTGDEGLLGENNELCLNKVDLLAYSNGEYFGLTSKLGEYGKVK